MKPGLRHFGIELGGVLEVLNSFRGPVGSCQQETDLVLIDGRLRNQLRQFFIRRERASCIARLYSLVGQSFQIRNRGRCLREQQRAI